MDNHLHDLKKIRHDFHRYPELGFQETRTKQRLIEILQSLNIETHEGAGVVGVLKAGTGNRAIGLRADMDALPITEKSTHDYVSGTSGVMHACGHDGHMTMLLGAAMELARTRDFDGTVILIFQPNEEHGLGAKQMIADGVLEQFPVDEIYAIHNLPGAPVGEVSTRDGMICASETLFEIAINGQGGHASMPHVGRDAITIGAELVQSIQTIISRKLPAGAGAVVSVTEFITNGQRNVLPGEAVLKGDFRALNPDDRLAIEKLMTQMANGICAAHGVTCQLSFRTEFIETINATTPTMAAVRVAENMGLDTIGNRKPMTFSEDFAHFNAAIPGCFFLLGNGVSGAHGQPLHSDDYDFNDELLGIGSKLWSALVRDRLPVDGDAIS